MSQFANTSFNPYTEVKIIRGKYKNNLVRVLSIYRNRKNKTLVITNKILEGKKILGKATKRKLVVSLNSISYTYQ